MPRIRRGGGRLRAGGGRTRKQDCCCNGPIPCETINDTPTRSTWEVQYELIGLSVGTELCGASCTAAAPLSGVIPYGGGVVAWVDWRYVSAEVCSGYEYRAAALIRCVDGEVQLAFFLTFFNPTLSTGWNIQWSDTISESEFILGDTFVLPRTSATLGGGCLPIPSAGVGTTCKLTVVLA